MDVVRNAETVERIAQTLPLLQDRLGALSAGVESGTGITSTQLSLMEMLQRRGPSTIGNLTRSLRRAQSSISELTDRLEERGLVRRTTHSDRRKSLVALTAAGKRWMLERHMHQRQALGDMLSALDPESREALMAALGDVLTLTDRLAINRQLHHRSPDDRRPSILQ